MDLIGIVFVWFVLMGLFLGVFSIIGIIVENMLNEKEDNFDDVEGIKRIFKEEDK